MLALLPAFGMCFNAIATPSHSVRGHVTKKGTYVPPSDATNPDRSKSNNYSHRATSTRTTASRGLSPESKLIVFQTT